MKFGLFSGFSGFSGGWVRMHNIVWSFINYVLHIFRVILVSGLYFHDFAYFQFVSQFLLQFFMSLENGSPKVVHEKSEIVPHPSYCIVEWNGMILKVSVWCPKIIWIAWNPVVKSASVMGWASHCNNIVIWNLWANLGFCNMGWNGDAYQFIQLWVH